MTSEKVARAFARCKHWDWLPGMVVSWDPPAGAAGQQWKPTSARLVDVDGDAGVLVGLGALYTGYVHFKRGARPVLSDPATLGCILELCRRAWADGGLCVRQEYAYEGKSTWHVTCGKPCGGTFNRMAAVAYPSEAHALLACLEARGVNA